MTSVPPPNRPGSAVEPPSTAVWEDSVLRVRGVGLERSALLERLGIRTVGDLLLHAPRRYEDRRRLAAIRDIELGVPVTVAGTIVASGVNWFKMRTRSIYEFVLDDGTGRLHCRWWNVPQLARAFSVGDVVLVHGKPHSIKPRQIDRPETERFESEDDPLVHLNRIVPIHALTEGLSARVLRTLMWNALSEFAGSIPPEDPDLVPACDRDGRPWPTRAQALVDLHFPAEPGDAERARARFALEEFIRLQLAIQRRRRNLESKGPPLPCGGDNRLIRPFLSGLGFRLTTAQTRVLREIRTDLAGSVPMRRLLQGDVGSGKTVVAACAALMALESGCDVVVMAPTEILAGQLAGHFRRWFEPLGIPVTLRAGGRVELPTPGREPGAHSADAPPGTAGVPARFFLPHAQAAPPCGTASPRRLPGPPENSPRRSEPEPERARESATPELVVGTHAVLQDAVEFRRLGLVIIDEQHKFGVVQREQLVRKGRFPHLLVMTATPIPRTLGLTLYGDLDISLLDQLPEGRQTIRTHVRDESALPKVWAFVKTEIAAGRQTYVVCPRVAESEHDEVRAVTRELVRVREALSPATVEMVHGQMSSEERDMAMSGFRAGAVQVLVATQVIEVGVDVPNATVIVILSAEQFGLAQLHQLRGRVGRGAAASHCILVAPTAQETASERLKVLSETLDGFALAEADLRLRGPGEFLGQNQSGMPALRFGDLLQDGDLVRDARDLVRAFFKSSALLLFLAWGWLMLLPAVADDLRLRPLFRNTNAPVSGQWTVAATSAVPSQRVCLVLPPVGWWEGAVPLFAVEQKGQMELRRLPLRGQEDQVDPLCFVLPLEEEPESAQVAGRWSVVSRKPDGAVHRLSWEWTASATRLSGRFDPDTDFRFARMTDGLVLSNQVSFTVEYIQDRYLIRGTHGPSGWAGNWRRPDDSEAGVWTATRVVPEAKVQWPATRAVLREWRRPKVGEIWYTVGEERPPGPEWELSPRPLGRVWVP